MQGRPEMLIVCLAIAATVQTIVLPGCAEKCRSQFELRDGKCFPVGGSVESGGVGASAEDAQSVATVSATPPAEVTNESAFPAVTTLGSAGISAPMAAAGAPGEAAAGAGSGGSVSDQGGAGSMSSDVSQSSACPSGDAPVPELCDAIDNDCDGKIDEALVMNCGSLMVGACKMGTQACSAGQWSTCEGAVEPVAEVCDAMMADENCDGASNEGCACTSGESRACGMQVGVCQMGTQSCEDGAWSNECMGSVGPQGSEECDGVLDENCDGNVDEQCECTNGDSESCVSAGACTQGMRTCANGRWGTCSGSQRCTGERVCDTRASQCVDCLDGDMRPCGDNDNPPCKMGTQRCSNHRWESSCQGEVLPEREDLCNGVDDDCNGRKDDGCGGGQSCMEFGGESLCAEAAPSNIQSLCRNCIKDGNVVKCEGCNGNTSATQYEGTCSRTLTACGGKLVCVPSSYSTASPNGELQLCTNVRLSSDRCTLAADCKVSDMQTNTIPSSIEVRTCTDASGNYTGLLNCGGYLRCTSSC